MGMSRSRIVLWAIGATCSLAIGVLIGSLTNSHAQAGNGIIEVNTSIIGEPVTLTRSGEGGALLCAGGAGGQFCTSATAKVPAIGVTESADGSVRITLLDPQKQGLSLVVVSGTTRATIPTPGDSSLAATRLDTIPDKIEAVTPAGDVVAKFEGSRLAELRQQAEKAASEEQAS